MLDIIQTILDCSDSESISIESYTPPDPPPARDPNEIRFRRKGGRARSGTDSTGSIVHAVRGHWDVSWEPALCGATPQGRSVGWSSHNEPAPTCPRCIKLYSEGSL